MLDTFLSLYSVLSIAGLIFAVVFYVTERNRILSALERHDVIRAIKPRLPQREQGAGLRASCHLWVIGEPIRLTELIYLGGARLMPRWLVDSDALHSLEMQLKREDAITIDLVDVPWSCQSTSVISTIQFIIRRIELQTGVKVKVVFSEDFGDDALRHMSIEQLVVSLNSPARKCYYGYREEGSDLQ